MNQNSYFTQSGEAKNLGEFLKKIEQLSSEQCGCCQKNESTLIPVLLRSLLREIGRDSHIRETSFCPSCNAEFIDCYGAARAGLVGTDCDSDNSICIGSGFVDSRSSGALAEHPENFPVLLARPSRLGVTVAPLILTDFLEWSRLNGVIEIFAYETPKLELQDILEKADLERRLSIAVDSGTIPGSDKRFSGLEFYSGYVVARADAEAMATALERAIFSKGKLAELNEDASEWVNRQKPMLLSIMEFLRGGPFDVLIMRHKI